MHLTIIGIIVVMAVIMVEVLVVIMVMVIRVMMIMETVIFMGMIMVMRRRAGDAGERHCQWRRRQEVLLSILSQNPLSRRTIVFTSQLIHQHTG